MVPNATVGYAGEESPIGHARALSQAFRDASHRATPSVVTILARSQARQAESAEALRELLQDPRMRELFPEGRVPFEIEEGEDGPHEGLPWHNHQIGSGMILQADGLILTNGHVVQDADEVVVRLHDGEEYTANDIRIDPLSDIAVLRIESSESFPVAHLGNSADLEIGDWVIAIGSPFELEATVSAGIISGKGRSVPQIRRGRLLQTDAAVNPGNSGGPLVNLDGDVVGINTAIATSSGGYQGIGFAIPIDRAKWIVGELVEHGHVRRALLGIQIQELTADVARQLDVPARSGVVVTDAMPNGPAASAGIRRNDVIVEFAGERVRSPRDLQDVVERQPVGSQQMVTLVRDGETEEVEVTLSAFEP